MDPDSASSIPNIPFLNLMNGAVYNHADHGAPIDVFINEDGTLWSHAPWQSVPETPALSHDPSWGLIPQGSGGLDFAAPPTTRAFHFQQDVPQSPYGPGLDAAGFGPVSDSMESIHSLPLLSQHPSNEASTPGREEVLTRRARRQPRIRNGYKCQFPECQTICHTQGELTKHCLRKHTPESHWRFACAVCGKRNYDKRDHGRHMKSQCGRVGHSMGSVQLGNATDDQMNSPSASSTPSDSADHQRNTRSGARKSRKGKATGSTAESTANELKTLDFYRANHDHDTAKEALAAATSDLLRFINLRAAQIKIEAIVPCSNELITFTAVHGIKKVDASPLSRTPSTMDRSTRQADVNMLEDELHPSLGKRSAEEQSHSPRKKSRRPSTPISTSPHDLDVPRASVLRSPTKGHCTGPAAGHQAPLSSSPPSAKPNVAITLTIRQRPGYQRSVTHPGHINSAVPVTREEPEGTSYVSPVPATPSKKPELLRKCLKQISLTWPHMHLDRQIRSSSGLAWARYTSKLHPGKSQEL